MISVESTKICSCIRVTPSWELSMGPRTVFTMASYLAYKKLASGSARLAQLIARRADFLP